jgi:hypothetical protein
MWSIPLDIVWNKNENLKHIHFTSAFTEFNKATDDTVHKDIMCVYNKPLAQWSRSIQLG